MGAARVRGDHSSRHEFCGYRKASEAAHARGDHGHRHAVWEYIEAPEATQARGDHDDRYELCEPEAAHPAEPPTQYPLFWVKQAVGRVEAATWMPDHWWKLRSVAGTAWNPQHPKRHPARRKLGGLAATLQYITIIRVMLPTGTGCGLKAGLDQDQEQAFLEAQSHFIKSQENVVSFSPRCSRSAFAKPAHSRRK